MSCFHPHREDVNFHRRGVGHSTGKTRWTKIAWSYARFFFSGTNPLSKRNIGGEEVYGHKEWLLGDGHVVGHVVGHGEVESTYSSFRLSFESQLEAEETGGTDNSSTSLMIPDDTRENQRLIMLKCRRLQSLERTISPIVVIAGLVRFQYQDILVATRNFQEERVLGRGALSCIYRASMRRGRGRRCKKLTVAIKKIHGSDKESFKTFSRELMIAGSLKKNPNSHVVPILGFSIDKEGLFLVYKYVAGGSLDLRLHPGSGNDDDQLSWIVRFKVALGTGRAVEYLHTGSDRCVIHRDIKPSNILLSSKNNPKLCDFGLATWIQRASMPFQCKNVRGTFGYLAPEYFQHGELSDKTDVYAFGVVLLELITGRKPIDIDKPCGDQNLVLWAKRITEKTCGAVVVEDLVDPRLKSSFYNHNEMRRTICAAFACLKSEPSERPTISNVLNMLCGDCGEQ